ncbi:HAD-IA family hydrolase [Sphingomonas sp. NIBR02145]|uniref:HAD-IA family hydrolase n=1 Tax=Sphingomonas sp. NIBR02145 TaxID=3014784 RepID=UPI0022B31940|nr:HAD-IA family hydrolase [Sphingomonas sp. NIBR02145]WHU02077.1 HAD-IA family hydrolase [Sphingomonas sp. NIBR02145]
MSLPSRSFAAFLFDMDGTLVNSMAVVDRVWRAWAARHGVETDPLMAALHGVRAIETIRRFAPAGVDAEAETEALTQAEIDDIEGLAEVGGAAAFLARIPAGRWALVTSAPRALALRRLEAAGIPRPEVVITAEDVAHGKPAPDCFLLGAERLGVEIADCLVWEDSLAGLAAADAAGAAAVVITETHHEVMDTPHPPRVDYRGLDVEIDMHGWLKLVAR